MAQAEIVQKGEVDLSKPIFDGSVDASDGPVFSTSEVAKVFFARSSSWLRRLYSEGVLDIDTFASASKKPLWPLDTVGANGYREYDLSHVEKMVHVLSSDGRIGQAQSQDALKVIYFVARIHRLV